MANTFKLIESKTLTSDTSSFNFTSIPATYTDLALYVSTRNASAGNLDQWLSIGFNNSTANYTNIFMWVDETVLRSANIGDQPPLALSLGAKNSGSNTWSNGEAYIFNYRSSGGKSITGLSAQVDTSNLRNYWGFSGIKWADTSVINTINITTRQAPSNAIAMGSTFYLYGIKNS